MRLGPKAMEELQAEITGRLSVGDELVVLGAVALGGTVILSDRKRSRLENCFSRGFLEDCLRLEERYGVKTGILPGAEASCTGAGDTVMLRAGEAEFPLSGVTAFYAMGEGGVLSALWKMAEASGVGLRADLRRIPIRQETIEVCERFDLNPYRLFSRGAVLAGVKNASGLTEELNRRGIMAAAVGRACAGNDRLLFSGENARYLERPALDELYKIGFLPE